MKKKKTKQDFAKRWKRLFLFDATITHSDSWLDWVHVCVPSTSPSSRDQHVFKSSGSQRPHSCAPPRLLLIFLGCTTCRCVPYLMSSSRSHSHWCLKCNLVSCSACVFFSSCVTLTWRWQRRWKRWTEQRGRWKRLSLRRRNHSKLLESSAVSFTCLTAIRFHY